MPSVSTTASDASSINWNGHSKDKGLTDEEKIERNKARRKKKLFKYTFIVIAIILFSMVGFLVGYMISRRAGRGKSSMSGNTTSVGNGTADGTGPFAGSDRAICTFLQDIGGLNGTINLHYDRGNKTITTSIMNDILEAIPTWMQDTKNQLFALQAPATLSRCATGNISKSEVYNFSPSHKDVTAGRLGFLEDKIEEGGKYAVHIRMDQRKGTPKSFAIDDGKNLLGHAVAVVLWEDPETFKVRTCCIIATTG